MVPQWQYPIDEPRVISQTYEQHLAQHRMGYNPGLDFAVEMGTRVMAAAQGAVKVARCDEGGYGTHVRVEHDGYVSIYAHLSEISVQVGDYVQAGAVLGLSGNTGNSTGPHLHWEVRIFGETPIDPLPLVSGEELIAAGLGSLPLGLPMARLEIASVNVREMPSAVACFVKTIQRKDGQGIPVIGSAWVTQANGLRDLWLMIGHKQWIVAIYSGQIFCTIDGREG